MAFKISDLVAASLIDNTDIVHTRTTGGIDKKVTGANLRTAMALGFVIENRTSDPGGPATAQIWFRTDL